MSFIQNDETSKVYAPGYFLAHEECTRETRQIKAEGDYTKSTDDGGRYAQMGAPYPNAANPIGFLYEDVDVTNGDMPGSVVTKGVVYKNRIIGDYGDEFFTALEKLGFTFVDAPTVTRPDWTNA